MRVRRAVASLLLAALVGGSFASAHDSRRPMELAVWDVSFTPISKKRIVGWMTAQLGHAPDPAAVDQEYRAEMLAARETRARLYPLIRALRATHVREWVHWVGEASEVQSQLDQYDDMVSELAAQGLEFQFTISGSLPVLTDPGDSIEAWLSEKACSPDVAEFGRFVRRVVSHFRGRVRRYSLWNEPNTGTDEIAAGSPADVRRYAELGHYAACLKEAVPLARVRDKGPLMTWLAAQRAMSAEHASLAAMLAGQRPEDRAVRDRVVKWCGEQQSALFWKKDGINERSVHFIYEIWEQGHDWVKGADPSAEYLVGELLSINAMKDLESYLRRGSKPIVADGFALHPYQDLTAPERKASDGGIGDLPAVQRTLARLKGKLHTERGEALPLYLTEFGYHQKADADPSRGLPEATRARWAPRAFEWAKANGAREMFWYQLQSPAPQPPRWNTGVLDANLDPLPTLVALEKWSEWQAGSHPKDAWRLVKRAPSALTIRDGTKARVTLVLENVGEATWTPRKTALEVSTPAGTARRIPLAAITVPTQEASFHFELEAPKKEKPGRVTVRLRLLDAGRAVGRDVASISVTVTR